MAGVTAWSAVTRPSCRRTIRSQEAATSASWVARLYQILDRLVRDGYITRSPVPQSDRPDKNQYSLTPSGGAELHDWATSAWARTGGYRDEPFLKLFGAASLGTEELTALVETQRSTYLSEIAGLTRLRRTHTGDRWCHY